MPPKRVEEAVAHAQVARVAVVEQRRPAPAGEHAVGRAVAARVAHLQVRPRQPGADAALDLAPHVVDADRARSPPSSARGLPTRAAGWKESIPKRSAAQLRTTPATWPRLRGVTVMLWARSNRDAVLGLAGARTSPRSGGGAGRGRPRGAAAGCRGGRASASRSARRSAGGRNRGRPSGVERERAQVVLVEVAVGHAHRLAAVALHHLQRVGVRLGPEQRDLAADQLRVLAGRREPRAGRPSGGRPPRACAAPSVRTCWASLAW